MSRLKTISVEVVAPILAFIGLYIAGTVAFGGVLSSVLNGSKMVVFVWASLGAAAVANLVCVAVFDRFRLHLGIVESPATILLGLAKGAVLAVVLVSAANALILLTTDFRHTPGSGVDWLELIALFVPAAIHEELVFRGYLMQKPAKLNVGLAVAFTSLLFAFVHRGNDAVGPVALANIFLAGVLLALVWVWRRNLWIPIGLHICWNVYSGPFLGHEVSGLLLPKTLLRTVDPGPDLLTGGAFGIEASIFLTLAEFGAIAFVSWRIMSRTAPGAFPSGGERGLDISIPSGGSDSPPVPVGSSDPTSNHDTEI